MPNFRAGGVSPSIHCCVYTGMCISPLSLSLLSILARTLGHSLRTHSSSSKNEPRNWLVEGNPSLKISLQQPHITGQYHPNNGAARIRPRAHLTSFLYTRVQFAATAWAIRTPRCHTLHSSSRHYARAAVFAPISRIVVHREIFVSVCPRTTYTWL